MTPDEYHELMQQMYDVAQIVIGRNAHHERSTILQRMKERVQESAPHTTLDQAVRHHLYVVTRVNFADNHPDWDPLIQDNLERLTTMGLTVGALVAIVTKTGGNLEIELHGSRMAIREVDAMRICVTKMPPGLE